MLVISVSILPLPPESRLFYIRMVMVSMGPCRLLVVVSGLSIVPDRRMS